MADSVPSFTLYPIHARTLQTCYESKTQTLLCNLNGPRYQKKHDSYPTFNVIFTQGSNKVSNEQLKLLQSKVVQVLRAMVVIEKYQRASFDISFDIIQYNHDKPVCFVLSAVLNLLYYTATLRGLQIKGIFSCAAVNMNQGRICVDQLTNTWMILCVEHRHSQTVFLQFEGDFNYQNYQRLCGWLFDANNEIKQFIVKKINETYGVFNALQ